MADLTDRRWTVYIFEKNDPIGEMASIW